MLNCKDLNLELGGKNLFKNFNISANESDLIWLQGKNGDGKTSLLKILAGVIYPNSGVVTFQGKDIRENLVEYHQQLHFLMHNKAIDLNMKVFDFIEFWANIYNNPELIEVVITYFDLNKYLDMECFKLSQGWLQKLALSRLMLANKKIWLLDEPFANLDDNSTMLVLNLINIKCENNGIVIFTSHNNNLDLKNYIKLDIGECILG